MSMRKNGNRFTEGQVIAFGHTKHGQELIIRVPKLTDVSVLQKFISAVIKEDTYISTSRVPSIKEETNFVRSRLQHLRTQDGVYLTAWVGKQLAGVCGIDRRGASTRTCHRGGFGITVAKKFRGQGVGRQIALATLDAAQTAVLGLRLIELEVFANNSAAIGLYKKLGFKQYGRLPGGLKFKGKYVDEIFMCKTQRP